jgi:Arc/MetJ-type ribon-helix-helix transcriptional regulator
MFVAKSIKVLSKKKRGRPPTGRDPATTIRLAADLRAAIDAWSLKLDDRPSRSEAIRRLIEFGLARAQPATRYEKKAESKASKMAGREIDNLGDGSTTDKERARRKRRLLKGPKEFRKLRAYSSKAESTRK